MALKRVVARLQEKAARKPTKAQKAEVDNFAAGLKKLGVKISAVRIETTPGYEYAYLEAKSQIMEFRILFDGGQKLLKDKKKYSAFGSFRPTDDPDFLYEGNDLNALAQVVTKHLSEVEKKGDFPNLKELEEGIYLAKSGSVMRMSLFEDQSEISDKDYAKISAFLQGKLGFYLMPYQHDFGYIFSEKPLKLGRISETNELFASGPLIDCPGKGVLIIGLGDD